MTNAAARMRWVLVLAAASLVGCAQPVDEETSSDSASALETAFNESTEPPTIVKIEKPLNLELSPDFFKQDFQVRNPVSSSEIWKPARVDAPLIVDAPSTGAAVVNQLKNGFGSGPCRARINLGRKEIGFRCTWKF